MRLITETLEKKQHVLIVESKKTQLRELLTSTLEETNATVYVSSELPNSLSRFDIVFIVNKEIPQKTFEEKKHPHCIFLFTNSKNAVKRHLKNYAKLPSIKTVSLDKDECTKDDIDRIIWFALSKSSEAHLHLRTRHTHASSRNNTHQQNDNKASFFTKKRIVYTTLSTIISFFALINILYLGGFIAYYQGYSSLGKTELEIGNILSRTATTLYHPIRPIYLLFPFGFLTDSLSDLNNKLANTLESSITIEENAKQILTLISKQQKTEAEKQELMTRFDKINSDVKQFRIGAQVLIQKLPTFTEETRTIKSNLNTALEISEKIPSIVSSIQEVLSGTSEKKYMLIMVDNNRLWPGGGIVDAIGSITIKDFAIRKIELVNVSKITPTITTIIEPTESSQPFVSAPYILPSHALTSQDLTKNYSRLKTLMQNSQYASNYQGVVLVTYKGLSELLKATDGMYFSEEGVVNARNLFEKQKSKKGSIFIQKILNQLVSQLPNTSPSRLLTHLKSAFDSRAIAILSENIQEQKQLDSLYWSGNIIGYGCFLESQNCIADFAYPAIVSPQNQTDTIAVQRNIAYKVNVDAEDVVNSTIQLKLNPMEKSGTIFLSILLPNNVELDQVIKDGVLIDEVVSETGEHQTVVFPVMLKSQHTSEVTLSYHFTQPLKKGKNVYQLILQKQIGSENAGVTFELIADSNIKFINQNFNPLVKENRIFYNTLLSTDKIFIVELQKQ
ncbi:MAG: DUF4012 domain-containing protein [Patescibacteria group bacterium]